MTTADEPRYILSPDASTRLITERRKIEAGTPLRACPRERGCDGWLIPRDPDDVPYDPIMIPIGNGAAKVLLEGRCDNCCHTFTWPLGGQNHLA